MSPWQVLRRPTSRLPRALNAVRVIEANRYRLLFQAQRAKVSAMSDSSWQSLLTVFDTLSAQVLTERLNGEGVPTRVRSDSEIFGVARRCEIFVPAELLPRAQRLLAASQFSDAELSYLATGQLGSDRVEEQ